MTTIFIYTIQHISTLSLHVAESTLKTRSTAGLPASAAAEPAQFTPGEEPAGPRRRLGGCAEKGEDALAPKTSSIQFSPLDRAVETFVCYHVTRLPYSGNCQKNLSRRKKPHILAIIPLSLSYLSSPPLPALETTFVITLKLHSSMVPCCRAYD